MRTEALETPAARLRGFGVRFATGGREDEKTGAATLGAMKLGTSVFRARDMGCFREMSPAERAELAFRLGDEDLESFRATHGLDRRFAIRLLERRRQATRQPSACLERLIG